MSIIQYEGPHGPSHHIVPHLPFTQWQTVPERDLSKVTQIDGERHGLCGTSFEVLINEMN